MKANELMIGDWVGRVFDDKRIIEDYRQVDWIRTGEIGMQYCKVWSIGCIEPIPLTPEILEKNGFKIGYGKHRENEGLIDDVNKHYYVKVGRWGNHKDEVGHCEVWHVCIDQHSPIYVHELQHALRLCGLTDLADNFKV